MSLEARLKLVHLGTLVGLLMAAVTTGANAAPQYTVRVPVRGLVSAPPVAPAPVDLTDPYFSQVKLLLHMSSPAMTDVKGNAVSIYGGSPYSTAQKQFGMGSATFAGNGKALMTTPFNPKGDFTVEGWVYPGTLPAAWTFLDIGGITNIYWQPQSYYLDTDGYMKWWASSANANSGTDISGGPGCAAPCTTSARVGPYIANAWNHFAVVRSGTQYFMYMNGARTNVISNAKQPFASSGNVVIGNYPKNSQTGFEGGFPGYLTELRLTDGVARYTGSTYSVPTAAFPDK